LPNHACAPPQGSTAPTAAAAEATNVAAHSDLPAQLTTALSHDIHEGGPAIYGDLQSAPPGVLIIAGCILRVDPGDPAKRPVGRGLGASVLSVHVQVYRGRQTHPDLIGAFDTEVQGENKLPPIGPVGWAVHGIRARMLTLKADFDKLAKLIARRVLTGQLDS
jgi:hypothetical protein